MLQAIFMGSTFLLLLGCVWYIETEEELEAEARRPKYMEFIHYE